MELCYEDGFYCFNIIAFICQKEFDKSFFNVFLFRLIHILLAIAERFVVCKTSTKIVVLKILFLSAADTRDKSKISYAKNFSFSGLEATSIRCCQLLKEEISFIKCLLVSKINTSRRNKVYITWLKKYPTKICFGNK